MVAVDCLEQLDAERLELIAADAGGDGRAGGVEIALEEGVGERTHGQAGDADMREQNVGPAGDRHGGMERMGAPGVRRKLRLRAGAIGRLAEPASAEGERL